MDNLLIMVVYNITSKLISSDAFRTKQQEIADALTSYYIKKVAGANASETFLRDAMPNEDFLPQTGGILSTIFPVTANTEQFAIQIPALTTGWYYALAGTIIVDKAFAFYGMEIPQSTDLFAVRMGYGKDISGGITNVYSLQGVGGADIPRIVTFRQPFLFGKGDNFYIQFNGYNPTSSAVVTGAVPLIAVATNVKSPM